MSRHGGGAELTRTPRGLRRVRTRYAYQPPALCMYRRRRAACPQGPTSCTYWVRVPASGVRYVPRTVATQVECHFLDLSEWTQAAQGGGGAASSFGPSSRFEDSFGGISAGVFDEGW